MLAVCVRACVWPLNLLSRGRRLHFLFLWLLPLWLPACLSLCLWPAIGGSVGSHIPAIVQTGSDVVCCPWTLLLFPTLPWCIFPSSICHFGDKQTPFPGFMWYSTSRAITKLLIETSTASIQFWWSNSWSISQFGRLGRCERSPLHLMVHLRWRDDPTPHPTTEKLTTEQRSPRRKRVLAGEAHC